MKALRRIDDWLSLRDAGAPPVDSSRACGRALVGAVVLVAVVVAVTAVLQ